VKFEYVGQLKFEILIIFIFFCECTLLYFFSSII